MNTLREALNKKVECPVCLNLLRPPVFMCISGHSFCKFCYEKVTKCPLCQKLNSNLIRNYLIEGICETLVLYPCENASEGCNVRFNLNHEKNHNEKCAFKTRDCPIVSNCKWRIRVQPNLIEHVKEKHPEIVLAENEICLDYNYVFTGVCRKVRLLNHNNLLYKICIFQKKIHIHHLEESSGRSVFRLTLTDLDDEGRKIICENYCKLYKVGCVQYKKCDVDLSKFGLPEKTSFKINII